jgi:hypothetical protein
MEFKMSKQVKYKRRDELETIIKQLELICDELVKLPKGVESHSWSDYKMKKND